MSWRKLDVFFKPVLTEFGWNSLGASSNSSELASTMSSSSAREAEYFASLPRKYGKPIITLRWNRTVNQVVENTLKRGGVPSYDTPEQCARAMYALTKYGKIRGY